MHPMSDFEQDVLVLGLALITSLSILIFSILSIRQYHRGRKR